MIRSEPSSGSTVLKTRMLGRRRRCPSPVLRVTIIILELFSFPFPHNRIRVLGGRERALRGNKVSIISGHGSMEIDTDARGRRRKHCGRILSLCDRRAIHSGSLSCRPRSTRIGGGYRMNTRGIGFRFQFCSIALLELRRVCLLGLFLNVRSSRCCLGHNPPSSTQGQQC